MAIGLDTAQFPPREREDALTAFISEAAGPTRVSHRSSDELIKAKLHYCPIGPTNGIIRVRDTNLQLQRTPQQLRANDRELFAVSIQYLGTSVYHDHDSPTLQRRGDLRISNPATQYQFAYDGKADNASFLMSHDDMGLPVSLVNEASSKLEASPLYRMVQTHLVGLSGIAQKLPTESEASLLLASTTIQLIRACVASTELENRFARDALHYTRYTTVLTYVRQHLREPSLNAQQIATANGISLRQLYKLWSVSSETLGDWILRERLEGARKDLAAPASRFVLIEVIARRWGFVDPSHFSRRFREAYGFSPREWRMSQSETSRPGSPNA